MGLVVSAYVVRDLIGDGEYIVECIEQREHGRVAVALTLRARAQPYSIQIETSDNKLDGFFRALLNGQGSTPGKNPAVNVGSHPVPVVEVDAMPADQPERRRRPAQAAIQSEAALREEKPLRAERRRSALRQLVLVPEETGSKPAQPVNPGKRRARATPSPAATNRR
jgi:hypothetical protein